MRKFKKGLYLIIFSFSTLSHAEEKARDSGCLVDQAALEDVKKTRDSLDLKMKDLESKEAELKAREEVISEQLKKIEDVRTSIVGIQETQKKEHQAKVAKLIETLLTMSPKAASKMLTHFDDSLAVEILVTMDTIPLAKIMNLMEPARSSSLSEQMTGFLHKNADEVQVAQPTREGGAHGDHPKSQSHPS